MVDGASGETGDTVASLAELESKSAHAPVPTPLRLTVEHNAQETTKKQNHVIMVHALVSRWPGTDSCHSSILGVSKSFCV